MRITILFILNICFFINSFAQTHDLNYYFEQAKTNSPLIFEKQTQNQVIQAEAQRLKAFYSQPEISLNAGLLFAPIYSNDNNSGGFQWVSNGAEDYYGYDLAISNGGQYQAELSVEQPLLGGKRMKTVSQNLDVNTQKNNNDIKLTEHDLKKMVGYQYLRCLQSQKQVDYCLSVQKQISNEIEIMKALVQNALYKPSDLQRLTIELENYKTKTVEAQSDLRQNLLDMNIICGINDTANVTLQNVEFPMNLQSADTSLFLEKYRLDSLNLWSLQQISEMKYKPQISLFANGGLNAVYLPGLNRLGIDLGVKFSWVLLDGHQKNIKQTETQFLMQDVSFKKQNFLTQKSLQLKKVTSRIESIDKELQMKKSQQTEYDKLMDIYKTELSTGSISTIDFVNTIRDVANLKQEIILLEMQKQALINTYNYWNY